MMHSLERLNLSQIPRLSADIPPQPRMSARNRSTGIFETPRGVPDESAPFNSARALPGLNFKFPRCFSVHPSVVNTPRCVMKSNPGGSSALPSGPSTSTRGDLTPLPVPSERALTHKLVCTPGILSEHSAASGCCECPRCCFFAVGYRRKLCFVELSDILRDARHAEVPRVVLEKTGLGSPPEPVSDLGMGIDDHLQCCFVRAGEELDYSYYEATSEKMRCMDGKFVPCVVDLNKMELSLELLESRYRRERFSIPSLPSDAEEVDGDQALAQALEAPEPPSRDILSLPLVSILNVQVCSLENSLHQSSSPPCSCQRSCKRHVSVPTPPLPWVLYLTIHEPQAIEVQRNDISSPWEVDEHEGPCCCCCQWKPQRFVDLPFTRSSVVCVASAYREPIEEIVRKVYELKWFGLKKRRQVGTDINLLSRWLFTDEAQRLDDERRGEERGDLGDESSGSTFPPPVIDRMPRLNSSGAPPLGGQVDRRLPKSPRKRPRIEWKERGVGGGEAGGRSGLEPSFVQILRSRDADLIRGVLRESRDDRIRPGSVGFNLPKNKIPTVYTTDTGEIYWDFPSLPFIQKGGRGLILPGQEDNKNTIENTMERLFRLHGVRSQLPSALGDVASLGSLGEGEGEEDYVEV